VGGEAIGESELHELEDENRCLQRIVADLMLDRQMLQYVILREL
jgi:hypothetical protein